MRLTPESEWPSNHSGLRQMGVGEWLWFAMAKCPSISRLVTTVKYLYPLQSAGWVLKPANPDCADIVAQQSLEVLGVVVGMFRRCD